MRSEAAIGMGPNWNEALVSAISQTTLPHSEEGVDLALLFASQDYLASYPEMLSEAKRLTGAKVLVGCSGQGVIGPNKEIERGSALSIQLFSLPGVELRTVPITQAMMIEGDQLRTDLQGTGDVNAWLLFADPFSLDSEALLQLFSDLFPGIPLVGGLASGHPRRQATYIFIDDRVVGQGAVALAISGAFTVRSVVSQGCAPLGETWTITAVRGNVIETIGFRPAVDVLMDTFDALPQSMQDRVSRNLLVGLAMNEYKDDHGRGDFLIRNIAAIDRESGVIAIHAMPRVGQTIQFQVRDPDAADEDLHELLLRAKMDLGDEQAVGALLCCCNGRGTGLFGTPDHDIKVIEELMAGMPVAGFFCNGEIGPVGGKNFLHGFTASMALIVPV